MMPRLNIRGILRDPLSRQALHNMAVAGVISRLTHTPHTIYPMDYDTRHKTFQAMEKFGGGFCRKLAIAWYAADTRNKERIETAFADYVAEYGPEGQFWGK